MLINAKCAQGGPNSQKISDIIYGWSRGRERERESGDGHASRFLGPKRGTDGLREREKGREGARAIPMRVKPTEARGEI